MKLYFTPFACSLAAPLSLRGGQRARRRKYVKVPSDLRLPDEARYFADECDRRSARPVRSLPKKGPAIAHHIMAPEGFAQLHRLSDALPDARLAELSAPELK